MSSGVLHLLWVGEDGRLLTTGPRGPSSPDAVAVVLASGAPHDLGAEVLSALVDALRLARVDVACRVDPVVDALVEVDADDRVVGHLDRSSYVRTGLPQVLDIRWWPRLADAVAARLQAGGPVDLAALVIGLGGRVATLDESLFAAP